MRDMLPKHPKKKESGIINLDISTGDGTHWVAYYKNNDYVEYFDSFGNLQPPLEVIKYLGNNITYNQKQMQQFNSFNCGQLSLEFLCRKNNK